MGINYINDLTNNDLIIIEEEYESISITTTTIRITHTAPTKDGYKIAFIAASAINHADVRCSTPLLNSSIVYGGCTFYVPISSSNNYEKESFKFVYFWKKDN